MAGPRHALHVLRAGSHASGSFDRQDEHLEEQVRQLSLVNMTSFQDPSPVRRQGKHVGRCHEWGMSVPTILAVAAMGCQIANLNDPQGRVELLGLFLFSVSPFVCLSLSLSRQRALSVLRFKASTKLPRHGPVFVFNASFESPVFRFDKFL